MKPDQPDILKYAALIQNEYGEILIGRKYGKTVYINIGGRVENDENPFECLQREIKEELSCDISSEVDYVLETPLTPAVDDPYKTVKIIWYNVTLLDEPKASSEIEEILWMNPNQYRDYELSPQIVEYLIPYLLNTK